MLKLLEIKNLFGNFNYKINFKDDISIIAGPNGFGKTTILRIIKDVLEDDFYDLTKITFDEIILLNSDNVELCFKKEKGEFLCNNEKINVPYEINEDNENYKMYYRGQENEKESRTFLIIVSKNESFKWEKNSEAFALRDKMVLADIKIKGGSENVSYMNAITDFYYGCRNVFSLGTDRLYDFSNNSTNAFYYNSYNKVEKKENYSSINSISRLLKKELAIYINNYARYSSYSDSHLLIDLSRQIEDEELGSKSFGEEDYSKKIKKIEKMVDHLSKYELLDERKKVRIPSNYFNEQYSLVFKLFADNYINKLHKFDKIVEKIDLFTKLINDKLLFKRIVVTATMGIEVFNERDEKIELNELSSGEQEIILLYFKLLFESDNLRQFCLFLVDEPELSLHIEWQYQIMDDFKSIFDIRSADSDFKKQLIICTHSPQIIGDHWDNVIELAELNGKK